MGEVLDIVSELKTYNATFSGATTGYSYNNPVIPAGFMVVNTDDASWTLAGGIPQGWDKGLVIVDSYGNQFVWIPVDGTNVTYAKWTTAGYAYNNYNREENTR